MPNGISHKMVVNDKEGVHQILKWLSYVPEKRNASFPIDNMRNYVPEKRNASFPTSIDAINRDVICYPFDSDGGKYDPRILIDGQLFDKYSFTEYQSKWAQSVCIGRTKLGGIPIGIIASETRTTTCIIPADATNELSTELSYSQAGQILYPDTSYKISQAINDFKCEQLPIFILANWRGFS
eukprot:490199_1